MDERAARRQDAPHLCQSGLHGRHQVQHVHHERRSEGAGGDRKTGGVAQDEVRCDMPRRELLPQARQHARRDVHAADAHAARHERPGDAPGADADLQQAVGINGRQLGQQSVRELRGDMLRQRSGGVVAVGGVVEAQAAAHEARAGRCLGIHSQ